MKKMLGNSITVIAVLVCAAVLLAPIVDARGSVASAAPGQGGPGIGTTNQMQAPPSGNTGNAPTQGGPGNGGNSGSDDTSRAPPSIGQGAGQGLGMGNMTGRAPPSGEFGNMTRQAPPSGDFGNTTAPGAMPGGIQGFGNMTPPERPTGDFGKVTPMGNGQGMGNMSFRTPPPGDFGNTTISGNGQASWQGNGNMTLPQAGNNQNPAGQKSPAAENQDIIAQIKAMLAKLF